LSDGSLSDALGGGDSDDVDSDDGGLSDIEDDMAGPAGSSGGRGDGAGSGGMDEGDDPDAAADAMLIRQLERKLGVKRGAAAGGAAGGGGGADAEGGDGSADAAAGPSKKAAKARQRLAKEFAKDGLGDDFDEYMSRLDAVLDGRDGGSGSDGAGSGSDGEEDFDEEGGEDDDDESDGGDEEADDADGGAARARSSAKANKLIMGRSAPAPGGKAGAGAVKGVLAKPGQKGAKGGKGSKSGRRISWADERAGSDDEEEEDGSEDESEGEDEGEGGSDDDSLGLSGSGSEDGFEDGSGDDEEEEEEDVSSDSDAEGAVAPAPAAPAAAPAGKYVPPHLRKQMAAAAAAAAAGGDASASAAAAAAAPAKGPAAALREGDGVLRSRKYDMLYGRTAAGPAAAAASADEDGSSGGSDADDAGAAAGGSKAVAAARKARTPATGAAAEPTWESLRAHMPPQDYSALRRRLQGLLNKLSDANVEPIAGELAGLYRTYAAGYCNAALLAAVFDACASEVQVLRSLVMVFGALLAALHMSVGPSVGAYAIEAICMRFAREAGLPLLARPTMGDLAASADAAAAATGGTAGTAAGGAADAAGDASRAKLRNNLLLLLCHLYTFRVAHAALVSDVLQLLAARLGETDMELLLLALTQVGFALRSEDPALLRDIIATVSAGIKAKQEAAAAAAAAPLASAGAGKAGKSGAGAAAGAGAVSGSGVVSKRTQVLGELLLDLRNNRKREEQEALLARGAQLRKWLSHRASGGGSSSSSSVFVGAGAVEGNIDRRLRITWGDLMSIPDTGRWWLVGSSWAGRAAAGLTSKAAGAGAGAAAAAGGSAAAGGAGGSGVVLRLSSFGGAAAAGAGGNSHSGLGGASDGAGGGGGKADAEAALLALAAKMRMNTPTRKSVFVALMGAEDPESAMDRITRLKLKGAEEREVVRVLLDCAGQEATYNPYYSLVAAALCGYHQSYRFTFQLAFWDFFKALEDAAVTSTRRLYNLSRLLAHLINGFALSFAVVKVLDFARPSARETLFLKALIHAVLLGARREADVTPLFSRLGDSGDRMMLRDGLALFLHANVTGATLAATARARADVPEESPLRTPAGASARLRAAKAALDSVTPHTGRRRAADDVDGGLDLY